MLIESACFLGINYLYHYLNFIHPIDGIDHLLEYSLQLHAFLKSRTTVLQQLKKLFP